MKHQNDTLLRGRSVFDVHRGTEEKLPATFSEDSQSCQTRALYFLGVKTPAIVIDTEPVIRSPAQRARRCLLSLLVFFILAVVVFVQVHTDLWSGEEAISSAAAEMRERQLSASIMLPATDQEQQDSAPAQLSVAGNTASGKTLAQRR